MIISALVGILLGAAMGWSAKTWTDGTRRRVLEELFSRKLQLADRLRDEAIKAANACRVELIANAERIALLAQEGEQLRESHELQRSARGVEVRELEELRREAHSCREAANEAERSRNSMQLQFDAAIQRATSAGEAMDQAYGEVMELTGKLGAFEGLLKDSAARAAGLEVQCVTQNMALDDLRGAVTRLNHELEGTREGLAVRDAELEGLQALRGDFDSLREALVARERELAARDVDLGRQCARIEALSPLVARTSELEKRTEAGTRRIDELEAALAAALERAQDRESLSLELQDVSGRAQAAVAALEHERARFEKLSVSSQTREEEARGARREVTRLAKELELAQAGAAALQHESEQLATRIAALEASLNERNHRIRTLTPVSRSNVARSAARAQPVRNAVGKQVSDDLKRIAGIGPVLAGKLKRLGVASFDQLAALTRSDLELLAEKLGIAAERIRREGWISSARVEARMRNGD